MSDPSKIIIFAIDDEKNNLDLMERTLSEEYEVYSFQNPKDAIAKADEITPQIIATDFRMPELNGVELVQELRNKGVRCVAVLITAYGDLDEVVNAARARILYRVVPKPWKPDKLKQEVGMAVKLYALNSAVHAYREFESSRSASS